MEREELYAELDFPHEVIDKLHTYEKERSVQLSGEETERLLERKTWDEAIRRLKDRLGGGSGGPWSPMGGTGDRPYLFAWSL